jgi:hypothetical protein
MKCAVCDWPRPRRSYKAWRFVFGERLCLDCWRWAKAIFGFKRH